MPSVNKTLPLWTAENTRFLLSFLAAVFLVYVSPRLGFPQIIVRGAFLALLPIVFRSKDDVFWLSLFFLVMNAPGRLFLSTSGETGYRLPLYNIAPGVSLGFTELFLATYIFKYLFARGRSSFIFARHFWFILVYGLFVLLYSPMLAEMTMANVVSAIRIIVPWAWVLILPRFVSTPDRLEKAFRLLSPMIFLTLLLTLHGQITGNYLHDILSGEGRYGYLGDAEERLIRVTHAAHLIFTCLFMSLFFISSDQKRFSSNFLTSVLVVSGTLIFLSATRGWLIGMVVLLTSVFFMRGYTFIKQLIRVLVILGLLFVAIGEIYPSIYYQAGASAERLMTLEQLAGGDITAGGTLSRISLRGPRVLSVFSESPLIGWGFSGIYFANRDGHVGNHTMLLHGGVLGYSIWLFVFLSICLKLISLGRKQMIRSSIGNSYLVILMAWLATFTIHSSSMQMLGFFSTSPAATMHWAWILAVGSAYNAYSQGIRPAGTVLK